MLAQMTLKSGLRGGKLQSKTVSNRDIRRMLKQRRPTWFVNRKPRNLNERANLGLVKCVWVQMVAEITES